MSSTPNKGKEKGEEPKANLNMKEEMINQGAESAKNKNKGKEIMMIEEPKSNNNRKAIILGKPDHYSSNHGSKNPNVGAGEEGGDQNSQPSPKEASPGGLFGHVINPPVTGKPKRKAPSSYNCEFCDKSFLTPQALGGHQNGHKWERHLKHGIQVINMAMGRSSSLESSPSSPTIPSCRPFIGNQGASLNPMTMTQHLLHNHNNNPVRNNGHQHDDGMFQHGGTASLNATAGAINMHGAPQEAGNNTVPPHSQWAGTGFGTRPTGALEIRDNRAFQYPEEAWLSPGFEIGYNAGGLGNSSALDPGHGVFQHPEGACFSPGLETSFNAGGLGSYDALDPGHGAFQDSKLAWINPWIGTGNYGGVDNTSSLHGQIDEAYVTQRSETSGIEFVLLPTRDYPLTGTQQVTRLEIDFGLVPEKDGEETQ